MKDITTFVQRDVLAADVREVGGALLSRARVAAVIVRCGLEIAAKEG